MSSIKELRKQLIDARKSVLAPTKKMKRDEIVLELEKYKKPAAAPVVEPAPAPARKTKAEAPPAIKIPEIPAKETAVDRALARKPKKPVEEAPAPPAPKAKKEEVLVKPDDIKKVLNKPPAPSKKGTPEMAEKMAKLRAAKKKSAE
jgi:hypothetical protein